MKLILVYLTCVHFMIFCCFVFVDATHTAQCYFCGNAGVKVMLFRLLAYDVQQCVHQALQPTYLDKGRVATRNPSQLLMSQSFPILLNIEIQYNDEFAFKLITTTANNLHLQKCITSKASKLPKRSTVDENLKKVAFNIASEASCVKIFSEQKFIKNAKNSQFLKN